MKLAAAILLFCWPAFGYNESVHAFITERAVPDETVLRLPTQADLDALRTLFWQRASANRDFAARYPESSKFTAWEFKQFVMLDPDARVHGFDLTADEQGRREVTRRQVLAAASRWPDDDERNRHRYLRDPRTHGVEMARDGTPMPYDPATLDFGSLTGTTSQGHAHYGLVEGPLSDDPQVLKKEPWRFAVPKTAHAYGRELVRIYTDLAALAAQSGLPSAEYLTATFAGAAFHHLQDVCNQIHTVQVGIYDFFESAFWQSKLRDLKTLGGIFGKRRSLRQVGIRIISNHHLLSEDYFAKHLQQLDLSVIDQPDAEIDGAPDLMNAIIERSSREGPEVYRLTWQFSAKTLHDGVDGHEYDGAKGDDPDQYVEHTAHARAAIDQFNQIELRGVRRAVTAVRSWMRRFPPPADDPVPMLIAYHQEAARRRAVYVPESKETLSIAWGYPAGVLVVLVAAALVWRSRKRTS
jgi:hypothetical protein